MVDNRVGLVNMGPTALRATATEEALARGASIAEAAALAAEGTDPSEGLTATPEYRKHLARVVTQARPHDGARLTPRVSAEPCF